MPTSNPPFQERTPEVNDSKPRRQSLVSSDGPSMVSHAGSAALIELSEGLGITAALREPLAPLRQRVPRHRPEAVVRDLAVSLADGGTCLSDLAALREERRADWPRSAFTASAQKSGPSTSEPTTSPL